MYKEKGQTCITGNCCAEFTKLITESSDSKQHHGHNKKTTGSPEARGERRETRRNGATATDTSQTLKYSHAAQGASVHGKRNATNERADQAEAHTTCMHDAPLLCKQPGPGCRTVSASTTMITSSFTQVRTNVKNCLCTSCQGIGAAIKSNRRAALESGPENRAP